MLRNFLMFRVPEKLPPLRFALSMVIRTISAIMIAILIVVLLFFGGGSFEGGNPSSGIAFFLLLFIVPIGFALLAAIIFPLFMIDPMRARLRDVGLSPAFALLFAPSSLVLCILLPIAAGYMPKRSNLESLFLFFANPWFVGGLLVPMLIIAVLPSNLFATDEGLTKDSLEKSDNNNEDTTGEFQSPNRKNDN